MAFPLDLTRHIAELVSIAGGIFNGFWDTPAGLWAVITEPVSLSTTAAPVAGISVLSIEAALAEVRRRFAIDVPPDASAASAASPARQAHPWAPEEARPMIPRAEIPDR
jgi:hypothetical protein